MIAADEIGMEGWWFLVLVDIRKWSAAKESREVSGFQGSPVGCGVGVIEIINHNCM